MVLWITSGCIDDNFDTDKLSTHIENRSQWGLPLVKTTFKMEDIVSLVDSTGFVTTDADGLIMLVYSDTAYSAVAEETIIFPDQDYDTTFNKDDYNTQGYTMVKNRVDYLFTAAAQNQLLDSVTLKSADLTIRVQSTFEYTGTLTITFPELKKDGQSYQKVIEIDDGSGNYNLSHSFSDVSDYKLDFTNFTEPNTFFITYELALDPASGDGVDDNAICDVDVDIRNIKYDYVWGFIGTQLLDIPMKSIDINIFSDFTHGEFQLYDPRLNIKVINSFGIPVGVYFDTLKMRIGEDDLWVNITGEDIPNSSDPWMLPQPELNYPQSIIAADTTVEITGTGSNLDSLVSNLPDNLKFSEKARLNYNHGPETKNFMSAESRIEALVDFELPLWGRTSGITFADTIDMDLTNLADQADFLEYIDLNIDVNNGLPHNIGMKLLLMDSLYNIVDSIPNSNDTPFGDTLWLVQSGQVDSDGLINQQTGKTLSSTTIRYENEGADSIQNVKYLKLRAWFITTDGTLPDAPYVKYYDYYGMDFDVNVDVKVNVNENF